MEKRLNDTLSNSGLTKSAMDNYINAYKNGNRRSLDSQSREYSNIYPELLNFANSYIQHARGHSNIAPLIRQGDNYLARQDYNRALDSYGNAIDLYTPDGKELVNKVSRAARMEAQRNRGGMPQKLEDSVQNILHNPRYNVLDEKIIYMRDPDGYVLDIVDNDNVLIVLMPQKRVRNRQMLEIYRITDGVQMEKIAEIQSKKNENGTFQLEIPSDSIKLGDLVYVK